MPDIISKDKSSTDPLLWWIMGIFASFILLATTFLHGTVTTLQSKAEVAQVELSKVSLRVDQVDELLKLVRVEQVERTFRFSAMGERITVLDNKTENLKMRFDTISERVLTLNKRFDGCRCLEKSEVLPSEDRDEPIVPLRVLP